MRESVFGDSVMQTWRDGWRNKKAVKGRSVIRSLARVMKGRIVSMKGKRSLRNSILLPTLTYGAETWTWNRAQHLKVHDVEMSYLRGACGVRRWDGESNESMYERCDMEACGVKCGVVEWVKINISRWLDHTERMKSEEFVRKCI